MSNDKDTPQELSAEQKWLLRLITGFFWLFLITTALYIVWYIFVPTPAEWPGSGTFPLNFTWENFWPAFIRHLAFFNEHFQAVRLIDVINSAFLTMFIYNIRIDIKTGVEGTKKKVESYVYVEWAMGSLVSGIIFSSARIATEAVPKASVYLAAIFLFAFISNYFLYQLRHKLKAEAQGKTT